MVVVGYGPAAPLAAAEFHFIKSFNLISFHPSRFIQINAVAPRKRPAHPSTLF